MLLSAISLACFIAGQVSAQTETCPELQQGNKPAAQIDTSNYVIDLFTGTLPFSYALNQCTSISLFPISLWYMYQCVSSDNSWTVNKIQYSDSGCTMNATIVQSWNEGDVKPGLVGYFVCDGNNDYAEVIVSGVEGCANGQTVFAGLGGCVNNDPTSIEFYCDSSQAIVQVYLNGYPTTTSAPATTTSTQAATTTSTQATTTSTQATTSTSMATTEFPIMSSSMISSSMLDSSMMPSSSDVMPSSSFLNALKSEALQSDATTSTSMTIPMCYSGLYCDKWSFSPDACSLLTSVKTISIYGKLEHCYHAGQTETTVITNTKKGASSFIAVTNLVLAVVAFFSLF